MPPPSPELLAGGRVLCSFGGPSVPTEVLDRLRSGQAAGLLLYRRNLASEGESAANARAAHDAAMSSALPLPPIIATDQEGGVVARIHGSPTESAAAMGLRTAPEVEAQGRATAELLLRWGVNTDFAPVADVGRPGTFETRSRRSFGSDPGPVATAVAAFVSGLEGGGVAATLKHFPGLGAASANTDHAKGVVSASTDELRAVDLLPFQAGIAAGAGLVMVSSAAYPALGPGLALTSPAVLQGLLREELGFDGVFVTDALDASAVAAIGAPGEAAVAAAAAGVDLFIAQGPGVCADIQRSLVSAITDGRLPFGPAQEAYDRVARLRRGLQPAPAGRSVVAGRELGMAADDRWFDAR
jgi:beta-N-acetylhexosaminidase